MSLPSRAHLLAGPLRLSFPAVSMGMAGTEGLAVLPGRMPAPQLGGRYGYGPGGGPEEVACHPLHPGRCSIGLEQGKRQVYTLVLIFFAAIRRQPISS